MTEIRLPAAAVHRDCFFHKNFDSDSPGMGLICIVYLKIPPIILPGNNKIAGQMFKEYSLSA